MEPPARGGPDAVLLPKVNEPDDIHHAQTQLDGAPAHIRLWAMMETPLAIANAVAIAKTGRQPDGRLDCMVAGTNDLAKDTGVALEPGPVTSFRLADADGACCAHGRA